MVDNQLRPEGVNDPLVTEAMATVPRERFVPADVRPLAYLDRSIPLEQGRALPSASVLGRLLTELVAEPGERALVVGAGTGYSAKVLETMGLSVTALECSDELAAIARDNGMGAIVAPLASGHSAGAPYDIILIDGAVEHVPDALIGQLADGGRLAGALIDRGVTRLVVGRKVAGGFGYQSIADAGVSALPGFARPPAFTF